VKLNDKRKHRYPILLSTTSTILSTNQPGFEEFKAHFIKSQRNAMLKKFQYAPWKIGDVGVWA
jgi:hypothetical protein